MASRYRNSDISIPVLVFLVVLLVVAVAIWVGYCVMMLCGILWGEFQWLAPIGFWAALGIGFFGGAVLGSAGLSIRGSASK